MLKADDILLRDLQEQDEKSRQAWFGDLSLSEMKVFLDKYPNDIKDLDKIGYPGYPTIRKEFIGFSHASLMLTINELERDLSEGYCSEMSRIKEYRESDEMKLQSRAGDLIRKGGCYFDYDCSLMQSLVRQANHKHPGINLYYVTSSEDVVLKVLSARQSGIDAFRFILKYKKDGHFVTIDCRTIRGETSMIIFEPVKRSKTSYYLVDYIEELKKKGNLRNVCCILAETRIQYSDNECGIFCLAFAKKSYKEAARLTTLHRLALRKDERLCYPFDKSPLPDGVPYPFRVLSHERLDPELPVTFYKHAQSQKRIGDYLKLHPGAEATFVNKKKETILERFNNNADEINNHQVSVSIYKKRIYEYKSLLNKK